MKCPLITQPTKYPSDQINMDPIDCLKEDCAWWDDDVEQCGFLTASLALKGMLALLGKLADKMPHEEQFRR